MASKFIRAVRADAVPPNAATGVLIDGWPVVVAQSGDAYYALLNRCTHAAAALDGGRVRRGLILCPLHGAPFRLDTGICAATAARYAPIRTFATRIVDDWVEVEIPAGSPAFDELPV